MSFLLKCFLCCKSCGCICLCSVVHLKSTSQALSSVVFFVLWLHILGKNIVMTKHFLPPNNRRYLVCLIHKHACHENSFFPIGFCPFLFILAKFGVELLDEIVTSCCTLFYSITSRYITYFFLSMESYILIIAIFQALPNIFLWAVILLFQFLFLEL